MNLRIVFQRLKNCKNLQKKGTFDFLNPRFSSLYHKNSSNRTVFSWSQKTSYQRSSCIIFNAIKCLLIFPQTHWTVANTAHIAARTKLNDDHPIRQVMKVFLYGTGAVNNIANILLAQDKGLLHRMTGFTYKGFSSTLR